MNIHETVSFLMQEGKGILAADESNKSMNARLHARGITESSEMRRAYRDLLLTTPHIEHYISGVILYEETLRQSTLAGDTFPQHLKHKGIHVGIKVDQGLLDNPETPGEQYTDGLSGLDQRLLEYKKYGASFAKWRAVFSVGNGLPTDADITMDTKALSTYAINCIEAGIVPILEPEVLYEGAHHIDECEAAMRRVLTALYKELVVAEVDLGATILKTSMVLPGKDSGASVSYKEVAARTVAVLKDCVPHGVGGVVFLSGGQSALMATEHLNEMALIGPHPWPMTFSYSRALQDVALDAWKGDEAHREDAQRKFIHRLRMNILARDGQYTASLEK